jgi:quercetin dioxygenase-like cupin family protein
LSENGAFAYSGAMVRHESEKKPYPVYGDGDKQVLKQILVGPKDGFEGYLREFTVQPGGNTPYHQHDWYHVVYIMEGSGFVKIDGTEHPILAGSAVHAPAGVTHGFFNTGEGQMRFLCLVPKKGDAYGDADG